MCRVAFMREIAWVLCIALLASRIGGTHAHVHLHFDGGESVQGAHMHVHTGVGAHQESHNENNQHVEIDFGAKAELTAKKLADVLQLAAPLAALLLLLLAVDRKTIVPRRRPVPIRVLSICAIRPPLRAPPIS